MKIKEDIEDKNTIVFAIGGNCDCGDPEDGSYHLISCPASSRLGVILPFVRVSSKVE